MLNTRSFSNLLSDMNDEFEQNYLAQTSFNSGYESHLDPLALTALLTEIKPFKHLKKVSPAKAYAIKKKQFVKPVRAPHLFNELQASAFKQLHSIYSLLENNFNLASLRTAYRKAALKTHPDQGGSSESFQETKKSYQILLGLVKHEV